MSAYLNALKGDVAEEHARSAQQKQEATQTARQRLTPLEDRLVRLLATIPVEVQRDGLSLAALQMSLRGRWRGHCHPGELGAALRKLGFIRRRCWQGGDGFQARWFSN